MLLVSNVFLCKLLKHFPVLCNSIMIIVFGIYWYTDKVGLGIKVGVGVRGRGSS